MLQCSKSTFQLKGLLAIIQTILRRRKIAVQLLPLETTIISMEMNYILLYWSTPNVHRFKIPKDQIA